MKTRISSIYRKLISPSIRFEVREAIASLQEQLGRACIWRWEMTRLSQNNNCSYDIIYIGRKNQRELAKSLLGIENNNDINNSKAKLPNRKVFVSEMPISGALCVPGYLITIIPLSQPLSELTEKYDKKLRQLLRKNRERYHTQQALNDSDIDLAIVEMLQPYATARRGDSAVQLRPDEVRKIAQEIGRLDLLYTEEGVVGCHLGYPITRGGKRYWAGLRVGFQVVVFSDTKRLHEANSLNNYLALEWAAANGFDYYDNGTCIGRPDDGLLQWKRRRGGIVDQTGNHNYFYVRLPQNGVAKFLWDSPLFAIEHNKLTLHLGVPEGLDDEEVSRRYRDMGFGGIFTVYLHCSRHIDDRLLVTLNNLYKHERSPPILEVVPST